MSQPCFIRPATAADVPFLQACAQSAYEIYIAAIGQKPAPMVFNFEAHLADHTIEVIEQTGGVAGYMVWNLMDKCLFLDSIAILPSHQGKGLASQAMRHLEAQAKANGKAAIELYTNEKMTGNLTLYPHLGFVETDRRQEDGFNRVFFRKCL
ncbi:GNAT family N-acetyltransferase [Pseudahrensia aquimaris]|uniref:GNAT family N-acetyltransferase n=1 Tax=Pseudahrensia aquimaris TaxID=744461 RepID=A0ABW3FCI6_9HYPH